MVQLVTENIKSAMESKGMNPASLARAASVNPTGVYDIMSGKSKSPRLDTVIKLAKALNLPVINLFYEQSAIEQRDQLASILSELPENDRKRLIQTGLSWLTPDEPLRQA